MPSVSGHDGPAAAFAVAPIGRGLEFGAGRAEVGRRLDPLTAELGPDRARARGWALAQTLAWAFDGHRVMAGHVATARWLLDGP